MCGIVGYVGRREVQDVLLGGLQKLEYRGYDSAGISILADGEIDSVRAVGNLEHLVDAVAARSAGEGGVAVAERTATAGIGHTRWATHGRVNETNAHPHFDTQDRVHVVVNGIVENYLALKERLMDMGAVFTSETDAEVIAHLVAHHLAAGDLTEAVRAAYNELEGHYAFVAMSADEPDTLVGARKECPLIVGRGEHETFLGSAIPAFLKHTRRVQYIENDEIVAITPEGTRFLQPDGTPIEREVVEIDWDEETAEKGGFDTFMLKEIHEQADAVAETIADRTVRPDGVDLDEPGALDESILRDVRRIVDRRLRHELPRGPHRPLRDRAVGAGPGRDGRRVRVPLPQPGRRPRRPRHRHHPVRRDRRHAGSDAPRARGGRHRAGDHERHGLAGDARLRRRALHPRRPRGGRRRHEDVRLPGRGDVPPRPAPRRAAGDDGGRRAHAGHRRPQGHPARHRRAREPHARTRSRRSPSSTGSPTSSCTSAATSASRWRSRAR